MNFATDICPLCHEQLFVELAPRSQKVFVCPSSKKYKFIRSDHLMPVGHSYEVFEVNDNFWRQDVNMPPFALDSDYFVIGGIEKYETTLYIWNDERKVPDHPGWTEVGTYPYIKLNKPEILIPKLQLLLPFA